MPFCHKYVIDQISYKKIQSWQSCKCQKYSSNIELNNYQMPLGVVNW